MFDFDKKLNPKPPVIRQRLLGGFVVYKGSGWVSTKKCINQKKKVLICAPVLLHTLSYCQFTT